MSFPHESVAMTKNGEKENESAPAAAASTNVTQVAMTSAVERCRAVVSVSGCDAVMSQLFPISPGPNS